MPWRFWPWSGPSQQECSSCLEWTVGSNWLCDTIFSFYAGRRNPSHSISFVYSPIPFFLLSQYWNMFLKSSKQKSTTNLDDYNSLIKCWLFSGLEVKYRINLESKINSFTDWLPQLDNNGRKIKDKYWVSITGYIFSLHQIFYKYLYGWYYSVICRKCLCIYSL